MKGYQTPQKVVSSSYLDLRHRVSSFSPRPRHSTTLIEGDGQKDGLEIIFLVFFVFLQKKIVVYSKSSTWWNIYAVSVFLQSPYFLLQFTLYRIEQQQLLALHTDTQKADKILVGKTKKKSTAENLCAHLYVSDLPVLTCRLGLTLVLVLHRLQAQLSVDTWQRQKRVMHEAW